MTSTATEAYEAMLAHHRTLTEELAGRADAVSSAVAAGQSHGAAVAMLIAYLAAEVLPHATAEERTIYPAAAARADMAGMVGEMIAEHATLSEVSARLAGLIDGTAAAEQAQHVAALFAAHAARENDVLLPALVTDESVDLAGLLDQMRGSAGHEEAHQQTSAPDAGSQADSQAADSQAAVVSLLLQAAAALARAGDADRACRIAAAAWAALHEARPDLAARMTAALHGLARRAENMGGLAGGAPESAAVVAAADPDLDVRDLVPAVRHETIFGAYRALRPGTGFVLVNDHDPKPLRYQFEAEHATQFTWDSLEAGPEVWRVRIGRPHVAERTEGGLGYATGPDGDAGEEPELDVRKVTHAQRHGLIFTAYRALPPGRGFVLVNDHDPLPLRYQFEAQHADEYTWDYLAAGPKVWRVRIGRAGL